MVPARKQNLNAARLKQNDWHNALPEWIKVDPMYATLPSQVQHTLQVIANACNMLADGSLVGAFGGASLVAKTGVTMRTFWRHVKRLEQVGYVVPLGRGGQIGQKNVANQYGIPGRRGCLNHVRCRREVRYMQRHEDGVFRPEVVHSGDTPTFWPLAPLRANPAEDVQLRPNESLAATRFVPQKPIVTPCQTDTGGRVNLTRGSCQTDTLSYPLPSPHGKNHGALTGGVDGSGNGRRPQAPGKNHIPRAALQDMAALRALWHKAIGAGLCSSSEHSWLQWVSMAEHCLRVGTNPGGLFRANVKAGRWLMITQDDEHAAQARIRREREEVDCT